MIEQLEALSIQKKYQEMSVISRHLISGFFKTFTEMVPSDINNVLDAGCGEGLNLRLLKDKNPEIKLTGFDIDDERIQRAKELNPQADIQNLNIYNLPYADNRFDMVLCNEVLEHLEQPEKALEELKRVSRTYILLSVPREPLWRLLNVVRLKYWNTLGNTPNHLNNWSPKKFKQLIIPNTQILKSEYPLPWQFHLLKLD